MSSRLRLIPRLPLLACLLTMLASGDDVCLPRLMLFSTTACAEAELPLDDPNTDFVEQSDASSGQRSSQALDAAPASVASVPQSDCAAAPAYIFMGHREAGAGLLNPPLRC
jgi:hypothetical protein